MARAIDTYRAYYQFRAKTENRVYEGVAELLAELHGDGRMLGVATAKPTASASEILEHFELAHLFSFVAGASLDSSRRDKRAIIAFALDGLGINDGRFIMVGDRSHDIEGALSLGGSAIGVTWGYGSKNELREAGAHQIVDEVAQLRAALRRVRTPGDAP